MFKTTEKLGEGGFGEGLPALFRIAFFFHRTDCHYFILFRLPVYRAVQTDTNFELAIKIVKNANKSREETEQLQKEMEILKKCRHPSIVQYFGFTQVQNDYWVCLTNIPTRNRDSELIDLTCLRQILMEVCDAGSLRDIMKSTGKTLTEKQVGVVLTATLQGLSYLHGLNIVHRDVKSGNILMTSDGSAKISDFGLAQAIVDTANNSISGSIPFLAPEVLKEKRYSEKSDIWALGITVIELLENTAPFDKLNKSKKYSAELQDFVSQCLRQSPFQRPSALQLLSHPFVAPFLKVDQRENMKELIDAAKKSKLKKGVRDLFSILSLISLLHYGQ
jgi:serine/threonine kinase 3